MLVRSAKLEKAKSIKTNSRISFKLILAKVIFRRFYFFNAIIQLFFHLSSYLSLLNPLTLELSVYQREKLLGFARVFIPELENEIDFIFQFEILFSGFISLALLNVNTEAVVTSEPPTAVVNSNSVCDTIYLTKPVTVNKNNRSYLLKLVRNGADNYPGAKILEKKE